MTMIKVCLAFKSVQGILTVFSIHELAVTWMVVFSSKV